MFVKDAPLKNYEERQLILLRRLLAVVIFLLLFPLALDFFLGFFGAMK